MSHQAQHVTNDRNSDETSASKAAAPMQSSNFSNFDPNHQWHFNDPFDFENNIYAQPHITNYAPALSERTDANAFDALTNNEYVLLTALLLRHMLISGEARLNLSLLVTRILLLLLLLRFHLLHPLPIISHQRFRVSFLTLMIAATTSTFSTVPKRPSTIT